MLTTLVTGNMIGSGIFLLPASLASIGSITIYSWVLTAFGAMALAFMFADLSTRISSTGGPYAFARAGMGDFIGFQTAYSYWLSAWIGSAGTAIALVGALRILFPALADPINTSITAISVVWLLTFINCCGIRAASWIQIVSTILKLLPIIFIIVFGWSYIEPDYFITSYNVTTPAISDLSAIAMGSAITLWAFIGLESATVPASSVINPKKTIPIATIVGTSIAAIVYIASSTIITGIVPNVILQESTAPFAVAASIMLGPWGERVIAIGAAISCFGALNGWILIQGQVAMAAANDGMFPKIFATKALEDTPRIAMLVTAVLMSILLLLTSSPNLIKQFEMIILLAVLSTLIPYLYTATAQLILGKAWQRVLAIVCALFVIAAIASTGQEVVYYGILLFLSSFPIYGLSRKTE